jgi:hypothetical protein
MPAFGYQPVTIVEVCSETGQLVQNQLFEGMPPTILFSFSVSNVF